MPEIYFTNKHFHDLNPLATGYQKCEPLYSRGMKKVDYYIIHFVVSGTGTLVLEGKFYKIQKNQAFVIPPNTRYYYQADKDDPWEYIWINFEGAQAEQLKKLKTPVVNIDYDFFKDLENCRNYAYQEADYLAGKLFLIIVEMTKKKYIANYILMAKNYMTAYYSQNIKFEEIAVLIGIDQKYLSKIFKKSTGQTMSEFLLEVRMRVAAGAIASGEKKVSALASMCGYNDPLYFSRQFKHYFGMSPTDFIDTINKNNNNES